MMFFAHASAQTGKVIDRSSLRPLEYVNVYNPSAQISTQTDQDGTFDFSLFANVDSITFSLIGYHNLTLSTDQIIENEYVVKLGESRIALSEVVVAANRWEQNKREVAQKISSIQAREVAFQNPQTTADLLDATNQVFVQKSQLGGGSPMIRGFSTNRVLLVVDGVRMNNAIFRSGNLQNVISLDAAAIENAEVVFGPGSVIYGSDAIGGVMDFHTLTPKLSAKGGLRIEGDALARWSSANNEKTGSFNFNIGGSKWASVTSFTYADYDDLRMGSNGPEEYLRPVYQTRMNGEDRIVENDDPEVQVPTGYSQWNVLQKVRFRPSKDWDFTYNFQYSTRTDVPRYDRLIQHRNGQLRSAEWYYELKKWMMHSLNATHFSEGKLYDQARLVLAFQDYEESRNDRRFGRTSLRQRTETVQAFSANLDFDLGLSEQSNLFYGLEAVYNDVGSTAFIEDIETGASELTSTRYPDGSTWQSYAAYVNYKNNLSPNWTLLAGARYNQVILNAPFDRTFFPFPFEEAEVNDGALNGSLGLVYRPTEDWQFNLNGSTGFRAPNVDDIGKVFDSEPGSVIVPNPDLRSEYAYNIDFGIVKTIADRVRVDVTGFYTILENALVRRNFQFNGQDSIIYDGTLSQVLALQNAARANVYGFQASVEADINEKWSVASYLTWTKGEEENEETGENVPLRHAPPLFGNSQVNFEADRLRLSLSVDYNGEVAFEDLAPSERGKPHIYATDENGNPFSPSWYALNFRGSYQFNSTLQLNVGVDNITDQRYRPYSSGIVAPGRNFILALRARF